jgi:hypothetical protein
MRTFLAAVLIWFAATACSASSPMAPTNIEAAPAATSITGGPGTPTIEFTSVPAYGSKPATLHGRVLHVAPADYHVAVYIKVGGWWTKPTWANPTTLLNPGNGTFSCAVTTGGIDEQATEYRAYLIPASSSPPLATGQSSVPAAIEATAVAWVSATRQPR